MPFGLHQIVIAVAFTTPFGGVLSTEIFMNAIQQANVDATNEQIKHILDLLKDNPINGDQSI